MIDFTREYTKSLIEDLRNKSSFLHVLIGPRQAGKSVAARQIANALALPTVSVKSRPRAHAGAGSWRMLLAVIC